jgi:spore germination protein KA
LESAGIKITDTGQNFLTLNLNVQVEEKPVSRNPRMWWRKKTQKVLHQAPEPESPGTPLATSLEENKARLREIFSNCADIVFRPFLIAGTEQALLVYIDGMADQAELDRSVLFPFMVAEKTSSADLRLIDLVNKQLTVSKRKFLYTLEECVNAVLQGSQIVLKDEEDIAVSMSLVKMEKRSIEDPVAEGTVRGPREGFIEVLNVNTVLLRRIIKSPKMKMELFTIGGYTKTEVLIVYIEGLAHTDLIAEAKARLSRIQIDGVLESAYLESFLEDNPSSPFPQIMSTERPDVVASSLLEGRIAIMMDGTPFVLVAPTTFASFLQSSEDYYQRPQATTLIRWMRYLFTMFSLLLPSLYIALITYHQEMVPTSLLISMATSREAVPFPALVEAILMEVTFEALREAGLRLPKQVGAAVSIVGALVIGQAAVQAGIVSAPMVIVVAITGISSFMIPRYVLGVGFRLMRFPMMLLAGSLGLLGIMLGIIAIVVHLCSLRSFGVPYLAPLAPLQMSDLKDVVIRTPWWRMRTRPYLTGNPDLIRQAPGLKPDPDKGGDSP